jgi:hypothetical protein
MRRNFQRFHLRVTLAGAGLAGENGGHGLFLQSLKMGGKTSVPRNKKRPRLRVPVYLAPLGDVPAIANMGRRE